MTQSQSQSRAKYLNENEVIYLVVVDSDGGGWEVVIFDISEWS
jgi:hypothetical protein